MIDTTDPALHASVITTWLKGSNHLPANLAPGFPVEFVSVTYAKKPQPKVVITYSCWTLNPKGQPVFRQEEVPIVGKNALAMRSLLDLHEVS